MRTFRLRIILTTSGLLLALTPAVGDENTVKINQDGDTHAGLVVQTGLRNTAGNDAKDIQQLGVDNLLELTQSGDDNEVGLVGEGLKQVGTFSTDGSAPNSAIITQESNGNLIGELVQTTFGAHFSTGNVLTVVQEPGGAATGDNTIYVIRQTVEDGASSNIATVTQTGASNWIERLEQRATSSEGNNSITLSFSGSSNGINGTSDGPGELGVLGLSAGARPSEVMQGSDASGGAGNAVEMRITGDYNQFGTTQLGLGNTIGARVITGGSNSFGAVQIGDRNQINGGAIVGDSNDLGILQDGGANVADVNLLSDSSDNRVGVGQGGDGNHALVQITGDANVVGTSQLGTAHSASIKITGDDNVALGIQVNQGETASLGNSLRVSISGSRNNALVDGGTPSFTGVAFDAVYRESFGLTDSLVVAPDVGAMLGYGTSGLQPGRLVQWGQRNDIAIDVGASVLSDFNMFAVLQKGSRNTLTASVNGSYNQFVVVQMGDDDIAGVAQDGDRNIAVVSQ